MADHLLPTRDYGKLMILLLLPMVPCQACHTFTILGIAVIPLPKDFHLQQMTCQHHSASEERQRLPTANSHGGRVGGGAGF